MNNDVFEPISQRGRGKEAEENRRIHEVADELRRRCQLYEAQFRNSKDNVNYFEVEQRVAAFQNRMIKENIQMLSI